MSGAFVLLFAIARSVDPVLFSGLALDLVTILCLVVNFGITGWLYRTTASRIFCLACCVVCVFMIVHNIRSGSSSTTMETILSQSAVLVNTLCSLLNRGSTWIEIMDVLQNNPRHRRPARMVHVSDSEGGGEDEGWDPDKCDADDAA